MGQIVRAWISERGNHVLEVKRLDVPKVSESGKTVQVSGTVGFSEEVPGIFAVDEDGIAVPLRAVVQIRRKRKKGVKK